MIKKIIVLILVMWGIALFYKKFMAPTLKPFFKKYEGSVDFFGSSTSMTDTVLPKK